MRLALVAANVNQPKGNLDGPRQDFMLATNDQLGKADSFRPLLIAYNVTLNTRDLSIAKHIARRVRQKP